jgi:hypothetical protein
MSRSSLAAFHLSNRKNVRETWAMNSTGAGKPRAVDVMRAKTSPASEFKRPNDVTASPDLSETDKKTILDQWEVDAQGLSRASDEGMSGGEPSRLSDVGNARRKLSKDLDGSATHDRRTSGKPQP